MHTLPPGQISTRAILRNNAGCIRLISDYWGNWEYANTAFMEAVAGRPSPTVLNLVVLHAGAGDWDTAMRWAEQALQLEEQGLTFSIPASQAIAVLRDHEQTIRSLRRDPPYRAGTWLVDQLKPMGLMCAMEFLSY